MKSYFLLLILISCSPVVMDKVPREFRASGADCNLHDQCASGVCDHYKADLGKCAVTDCEPESKIDNNHFYCGQNRLWHASRNVGEFCEFDFECFKQTCFMIPDCQLTDIPNTIVSCENNKCVSRVEKDSCEKQGLKRVLAKNEFIPTSDGSCVESMAQRELKTVCVPCGNHVCDEPESNCNCPEDC